MHSDLVEVGTPALHAGRLSRKALRDTAVATVACGVLLLVALLMLGSQPVVSLVAGVAAAGCGWWARECSIGYARASTGAQAERAVAKVLRRLDVAGVAHGAMLGAGGDADHVVAGPCCVVIETKYGRGAVRVVERGITVAGRHMRGDPVAQATRQAAALRKLAGVRVEAVVCISGMDGPPIHRRSTTVCSPRDLPAVIAAAPAVLDDRAARKLMLTLSGKVGQ